MAKLTRTQKYASLRDELANNKETATTSNDLSSYEDRFNNVKDILTPKDVVETNYNWEPFKEEPVSNNTSWESFVETPAYDERVQEEEPAQMSGSSYFDSFMSAPAQEEPEQATDFNSFFEDDKNDNEVEEIYHDVFNDVRDTTEDTISRKERDTYLNQTISDVNVHNIVNGEQSLNQIIDNAVNEVRHTEKVAPVEEVVEEEVEDNTYAWNTFEESKDSLDADAVEERFNANNAKDEQFSNTVNAEISSIIDQVANEPVAEEKHEEPVAEVKVEAPVVEAPAYEEKGEDIVEIKNLNELQDEPIKNTVSGTIPFVVSTQDDEDIEEDEDDEEGSNTVLNIILIVLIIVLVAVLGLIVFYILKTKGIF